MIGPIEDYTLSIGLATNTVVLNIHFDSNTDIKGNKIGNPGHGLTGNIKNTVKETKSIETTVNGECEMVLNSSVQKLYYLI